MVARRTHIVASAHSWLPQCVRRNCGNPAYSSRAVILLIVFITCAGASAGGS